MIRRPLRTPPPPQTTVLEVDPAASTLLDVLVELGHLDATLLEIVNDRLLDLEPEGGIFTLDHIRRVAAEVLFESDADIDPEQKRVLELEWGMLFY